MSTKKTPASPVESVVRRDKTAEQGSASQDVEAQGVRPVAAFPKLPRGMSPGFYEFMSATKLLVSASRTFGNDSNAGRSYGSSDTTPPA